jgi:hypothetical protein
MRRWYMVVEMKQEKIYTVGWTGPRERNERRMKASFLKAPLSHSETMGFYMQQRRQSG